MTTQSSVLRGPQGERVALVDVSVLANLRDLLSEVTVAQTYRNDERDNIEAVYTFPLPLDALLLDLQVDIAGRILKAAVVEKTAAQSSYEEAVTTGDAAIMLEELEPGLYTMNVGNLMPGEKITITFRYALLYRWTDDRFRFHLPTTVAPRFGESPHAPHQSPEASLTVENTFSLKVEIFGALREAQFVCPSHQVELDQLADRLVIKFLRGKAPMDRDFVLNVRAPQAGRNFTLCDVDGEGAAAIASFQPFFPGLHQPRSLKIAIVMDCSGSMQGDSMIQAKHALAGILDSLQSRDWVTIIAFGTTTNALSKHLLPCNPTNLGKAKLFAKQLDTNMGGTEIANALREAFSAIGSEEGEIFLVTDGEVSNWQSIVGDAKRSGHRIFTVGVGSAVSEGFVRALAQETGGACELVAPQEGMADRVIRHFDRMRAPRASRVTVQWPEGALHVLPHKFSAVFEGDTVMAYARFDTRTITGEVALEVESDRGEIVHHRLPILAMPVNHPADRLSTVARIVAAERIKELGSAEALDTALRYRLVTPWTNCLVVEERAENEKGQHLPALRKVPQTLAAGWGGVGATPVAMYALASSVSGRMLDLSEDMAIQSANRPSIDLAPLPKHFRRLLTAINDNPSLLEPSRGLELLATAGLATELDELLRHAEDLGLNLDGIASMILTAVLAGSLTTYLPIEVRAMVMSLHELAKETIIMLEEVGHNANSLARAIKPPAARRVFQLEMAHRTVETTERLSRLPEFLNHFKDCAKSLTDQLQGLRVA